ncbi:MAG: M14 family zinc carboxypeptidase [Bdellovibrionaceae bacterium]|nr:M14 family zinc carboxypeptidase [Pseudobdellovibrionaceae bacterium]MDW8189683.1 M14 family zinc carboxypeptidase [Pseudobdellovibrionaceae bacterium]
MRQVSIQSIGPSVLGLPIENYQFTPSPHIKSKRRLLILGGVHGDETEGVTVALGLLNEFLKDYPYAITTSLIPRFNVDGVLLKTRSNYNGVDLNRNLPTKDWTPHCDNPRYFPGPKPLSEPENQALVTYLDQYQPHLILSLHSWYPVINVNGECLKEAEILQKHTHYKIEKDIGYPTPGSLGTYAGLERNMPTITYEIERGAPLTNCLKLHIPAIQAMIRAMGELN